MNYTEFKNKWLGKYVEAGGSANALNQCVDLANQYIKEVWKLKIILGTNAIDFPKKWEHEYIENTPKGVPRQGDLVVFGKSTYGHISIFDNGDTNNFRSLDQNYPLKSKVHLQRHGYGKVIGWLRYNSPEETTMTQDEVKALEVIKKYKKEAKHGNLEGAANAAVGATKEKTVLEGTVAKLQKETDDLRKLQESFDVRLKKLEGQIGEKDKTIGVYQKEAVTANKTISKITEDLDFFKPFKSRYEDKCKESYKNQKISVLLKEILDRIFKHG